MINAVITMKEPVVFHLNDRLKGELTSARVLRGELLGASFGAVPTTGRLGFIVRESYADDLKVGLEHSEGALLSLDPTAIASIQIVEDR